MKKSKTLLTLPLNLQDRNGYQIYAVVFKFSFCAHECAEKDNKLEN
jgi:hypothetical protein